MDHRMGAFHLRVTKGKTGFRQSFSTESGSDFYNHLRKINSDYARPNNFLFLPKMENRNHDYDFPFLVRKGNYWAVRNHC